MGSNHHPLFCVPPHTCGEYKYMATEDPNDCIFCNTECKAGAGCYSWENDKCFDCPI